MSNTIRVKMWGVVVFLFVFLAYGLYAQGSGRIRGSVLDQATGDPLPGANILVLNTSLGTATDLNGEFILNYVPAGKARLRISYIGYQPVLRDIEVVANSTVTLEVRLVPEAIMGEEVIVTAQARGQQAAINQQISATSVMNVVSEERIQELPDFNAAQALSRLPGISTTESSGEANKIVVRGLAPQFNIVAVSGVPLASTGSTQIGAASQGGTAGNISVDRSVDLAMVTPYMIKTIEVHKTLLPDMNANAIGGYVNMILREAPSGVTADLMWQSGYTKKTGNYGNYRAIASLSSRFFDDEVLGAYVLFNAEKYDRDADIMNANYTTGTLRYGTTGFRQIQVTNVQFQRHFEERKRYGANLILDYKLPNGTIKTINMFSRLVSNYQDFYQIFNYKENNLDFRYREGENTVDLGMNSLEFKNDFGFISAELRASLTYSRNLLPYSPYYQFRRTGGVISGSVPYDTPPEQLWQTVTFRSDSNVYLTSVSLFRTEYQERNRSLKGDFKVPFALGSFVSGHIKFGGLYEHKKNINDQNTPYFTPTGANNTPGTITRTLMDSIKSKFGLISDASGMFPGYNFPTQISQVYNSFLGNKFGRIFWGCDPVLLNAIVDYVRLTPEFNARNASAIAPGGWFEGYFQKLPNDYTYIERNYAGYIMTNINVSTIASITGGVRYEETRAKYQVYNLLDARDESAQTYKVVESYPTNKFWLPMITTKLNVFEWFDIRYAYTQTLARPDYHQLSPHYHMSYDRGNVWAGNPRLKPAQSYNHDVILSFHSNLIGLFTVGAFYKQVKNFAYSTQYQLYARPTRPWMDSIGTYSDLGSPPKSGAWLYTFINNDKLAYVKGIEFELQSRFWFLPPPFDGIVFGANYSRINSEAWYPWIIQKTIRPGVTTQIDSTRKGRLINQPNDIGNAYIGFDYKGFSARLSFVYQGNSVSYIGSEPEQDGFTDDYFRVDFSMRQMLPIPGMQLFFDVNNINDRSNISRQITIKGFTSEKYYGMTANLGIRYLFSL
ncbi:MAG: TonB-dependent receptor [Bacteroidetes bacterium]|nr:TonB-dependent receptor [Bacteroidota bacterium]